jgi:hypothetical protein
MDTRNIDQNIDRTLELLRQQPDTGNDELFRQQLWQRIEAKYSVEDSFAILFVHNYRKAIMAVLVGLNMFAGAFFIRGVVSGSNDRATQLKTVAQEYSLVSDVLTYSIDDESNQ